MNTSIQLFHLTSQSYRGVRCTRLWHTFAKIFLSAFTHRTPSTVPSMKERLFRFISGCFVCLVVNSTAAVFVFSDKKFFFFLFRLWVSLKEILSHEGFMMPELRRSFITFAAYSLDRPNILLNYSWNSIKSIIIAHDETLHRSLICRTAGQWFDRKEFRR